jgi:hypothetical protein
MVSIKSAFTSKSHTKSESSVAPSGLETEGRLHLNSQDGPGLLLVGNTVDTNAVAGVWDNMIPIVLFLSEGPLSARHCGGLFLFLSPWY